MNNKHFPIFSLLSLVRNKKFWEELIFCFDMKRTSEKTVHPPIPLFLRVYSSPQWSFYRAFS
jgi:hypothetical protein